MNYLEAWLKKESPIIAAKRELKEETGIQVKKIVRILNYYRHSGYNCGQDTIFFTKVLKKILNLIH